MSGIQMALLGAGGTAVTITLNNQSIVDLDSTAAYAYYFLTAGGLAQESKSAGGVGPSTLETWCVPTSEASNYEVFVTLDSGTLSGGSGTGSWLALSSTRNWFVEQTSTGTNSATITATIRRIGTGTNLASATILLEAEVL